MSHVLIHRQGKASQGFRPFIVNVDKVSRRVAGLIEESKKFGGRAIVDDSTSCSAVQFELAKLDESASLERGEALTLSYACTMLFDPL